MGLDRKWLQAGSLEPRSRDNDRVRSTELEAYPAILKTWSDN
jgi:hypothetical protein